MKYLLLLLLVGCKVVEQPAARTVAQAAPDERAQVSSRVYRVVDKQHGVVCYTYYNNGAGGISCLPLMEPQQ